MWPAGGDCVGATIEQTDQFIEAYQDTRGHTFSPEHLEEVWAAGTWIRVFNGKKFLLDGLETLTPTEAQERAHRSGLA
jgi:hypothetical protein